MTQFRITAATISIFLDRMFFWNSANYFQLPLNQILASALYSITTDFSMRCGQWQIYRFEFNQGRLVQTEC